MSGHPYFSAERTIGGVHAGTWRGWVQFVPGGTITYTPDRYPTKRAALAAIKAQHG